MSSFPYATIVVAIACTAWVGCSAPPAGAAAPASATAISLSYDDASAWVCRPDLPDDACRKNATELHADGTAVVVPFAADANPPVDCFYVYPTVDLGMAPGDHTDFADTARMQEWTFGQVARFGAACRIYAPLYRQMTFGTYFASPEEHARRFETGYADVVAAFRWFLAHAGGGRPIVLVGHSQGAQIVERLIQTMFEGDSEESRTLRARLLVAMPVGGDVHVAEGSRTGGTFHDVPLCASADETGCVVAFGTFLPGGVRNPWPGAPPAGQRSACVNPADPGGTERHPLSGAVFPTESRYRDGMPGSGIAKTPFVVLPDFYSARCADGPDGFRYLAVDESHAPGDSRPSPVDLTRSMWRTRLGLHILDMQLTQADLVRLIQRKAAALAAKAAP